MSVAASVRTPSSASQPTNLVGVLLIPLPVGEQDPIRRLEQIARATAEENERDIRSRGDRSMTDPFSLDSPESLEDNDAGVA